MKRNGLSSVTASFLIPLLLAATPLTVSRAAIDPERESALLARRLKPITDDQWQSIAGEKAAQPHEILKGDTLYDISGHLFGDTKYWPKIWALNNFTIMNPHMIQPGRQVVFNEGSGLSLPSVSFDGAAGGTRIAKSAVGKAKVKSSGDTMPPRDPNERAGDIWDERTPKPSQEWRRLPRQNWESVDVSLPPEIDKDGFDSRARVDVKRATGFSPDYYVGCRPPDFLGEIKGARNEGIGVSVSDEVTIESDHELTENQVYDIVGAPTPLQAGERKMMVYPIVGKVRILGVNDGLYLGQISQHQEYAGRGMRLIAQQPKFQSLDPVVGPSPIQGMVMLNPTTSTYMTAQGGWVYVDRGTGDGVQPGMIFRMFQYKDPKTRRKLTDSNMLVEGDVQVYQSCEDFSLGQVLWSRQEINDHTPAILVTDPEDLSARYYLNGQKAPAAGGFESFPDQANPPAPAPEASPETPAEAAPQNEDDWLDKLDNNQDLNPDEQKELQQLEEHKDTDQPAASETPAPTETPSEAAPAPEPTPEASAPPVPEPDPVPTGAAGDANALPEPPKPLTTEPETLEGPQNVEPAPAAPAPAPAPTSSAPKKPKPSPTPADQYPAEETPP